MGERFTEPVVEGVAQLHELQRFREGMGNRQFLYVTRVGKSLIFFAQTSRFSRSPASLLLNRRGVRMKWQVKCCSYWCQRKEKNKAREERKGW